MAPFNDFGLRSPVSQKTFRTKTDTSVVARVSARFQSRTKLRFFKPNTGGITRRATPPVHHIILSRNLLSSLGHGIAANSGSWGLKTPVMASHRLHRIPLAAVVVCLSSLQRQQLTACCCLLACARQSDTRRHRDKEDEIGHKHKSTRRFCERTGYYFAVPAVCPRLDAPAD